jgi:hypothetical protein
MGFEPSDFLLELIDPFLEGAQRQASDMFIGRRCLLGFAVQLLQFLEFTLCVLQLAPAFDAHG